MKSSIFNAVGEFFALDVGSSAIRVVQLRNSGNNHTLLKYGSAPLDVKTALSDAVSDQRKVVETVVSLVSKAGITTKNVVIGLPANKTFVTIVDLPKVSPQELRTTIKYQADQYIPMNTDEAKIDSAIIGDSPVDAEKMEVMLASVTNKYAEARMDMLEAAGFNAVAMEPDALALTRALTPLNSTAPIMIIDMGEYATDIVITMAGAPRLVRSIPVGGQTLIKSAVQNLNIDENQARQFVYKFGLDDSKLEGQIYRALESTAELVSTEVQKSAKFFASRYQSTPLESILTSGAAAILPNFSQFISKRANNVAVTPGNCWQNVSYSNNAHEQLMAISHQFAVAVGLAQRGA